MDVHDKQLLNAVQREFPLVSRPFQALGTSLDLAESHVMERIAALKRQRIIRQIGGIFDTRSLGYASSLVAMRVRAEALEDAAQVVNAHPGVSHNYVRSHAFNLWFTVAVPPGSDLTWTVNRLHEMAGADSTRMLPTLRLFKIGVHLDMEGRDAEERSAPAYNEDRRPSAGHGGLRPLDIEVIRALQEDLPVVSAPYAPMAERVGVPEPEFLGAAVQLKTQGYMRRMAAVLRHREAGFRANAMGVWVVPEDRSDEVGRIMGTFAAVSHCYLRPTYPDWPYNVFTMVHGQTPADCQGVVDAMARATGIPEYALLYSTKEYKKTRLKYFTPDIAAWEARVLGTATPAPTSA